MPRPKPEIERTALSVRFLPDQLARIDAWADGPKVRNLRIEQLIDLGLDVVERRAKRQLQAAVTQEE